MATDAPPSAAGKLAVITGGNRGLGLEACRQLASQALIQGSGRVVNVSSSMGQLAEMNGGYSGMGQLAEMNGGYSGYRLSKAALNALTRILADKLRDTGIKVNSVCAGWVKTDMGGPDAPRTPGQGVETIVWLATLPDDGPTGGFFRDKQPIPW
jgi:NAD(P)-dependent dehydrogenase (short-subunit alcohol dehydrogenase family)